MPGLHRSSAVLPTASVTKLLMVAFAVLLILSKF